MHDERSRCGEHIWALLAEAAVRFAERVALVEGERTLSYRQLADRALRLAGFLAQRGVAAGDRVAILDRNSGAFVEAYFAAAALGAILNPLNVRLSAGELHYILEDAGARWLLARGDQQPIVREVLARGCPRLEGVLWLGPGGAPGGVDGVTSCGYGEALAGARAPRAVTVPADAVAQLYYTSGTTGEPKGVMLTHRNVCVHAAAAVAELGLCAADRWGHIAPMFHLADAWATFAITAVGGCHVIVPGFSAGAALAAIERQRITVTNLIPTMLNLMVKDERAAQTDLSSVRLILSGGAPIAPELVRRVIEVFGCEYVQTYGMTETSPYLTLSLLSPAQRQLPPAEQLALRAKTGRAFRGVELKVVDEAGRPVAADSAQVGEILVRGATVTPGYWRRPAATAEAFTADGWLRTGDLAVLDEHAFVNIVDRKKDLIISGGENIYSVEVEHVLYQHPGVLEAAVYGVADETWGERVEAAVVLRAGEACSAEALIAFCRARLAAFKAPRAVRFLDALPKTGSGKIQKRALRDEAAQRR